MIENTIVSPQSVLRSNRPQVDGKFLKVNGERFWIKGVTYGSFSPNDEGEPYPPFHKLKDDFARMRDAGINTARLYNSPTPRIADAAWEQGLMLIPEVSWGPRSCVLDTQWEDLLYRDTEKHTRELAGHPAILMYSVGNEMPPLLVRWYGARRVKEFLRRLCNIVKEHSDGGLITYINHPPTEYIDLPNFDVVSYNIYLEEEETFRKYLARLHSLAGDRPLFLAELGLDSSRGGREAQAAFFSQYLRATFEKGLCGAAVYSWTDEWSIHSHEIEGWAFGITDAERRPKPSLAAVSEIYGLDHYQLNSRNWPRVTVVVATYNGTNTLAACLESLGRLKYPNYEVLVVDDGSTKPVHDIAVKFPVRYHRVEPNGGLSNARNMGMNLAEGDIVAYIDDDAFADPDWLYFMVQALLEQKASAVGGPNLSPTDEQFTAQCVHHAPGNPTHVLLGDEIAEHVPGCNMAYVKRDLAAIGGFDVTHRAAGDDVDVCWKLLVREKKIAFSPAAIVWHRRRHSVRAYLKQQRGYGYAEAHLHDAYPSRFNVLGHSVWRGCIYDGITSVPSFNPLPAIFQPRIYYGFFGSAMFQAMYQPKIFSTLTLFKSIEWQILFLGITFSGILGLPYGRYAAWLLLPGLVGLGITLFSALCSGIGAAQLRQDQWTGMKGVKGAILVTLLHLFQPWSRFWGRINGAIRLWSTRRTYPEDQRLWGNLWQRDRWLGLMTRHLRSCGWVCEAAGEWDDCDLFIRGPGFHEIRLISVYEEVLQIGAHRIRYRLESRSLPNRYLATLAIIAGFGFIVLKPVLLPLAIPLGAFATVVAFSRRHALNAISQAALECGEAMEMTMVAPEDQ